MSRYSQFCCYTFEDEYRRRCEQCVRLDIRGSMNRLRQHQQVRDVMVSVSRNELRPFLGSHEPGQERLEQLERCPRAHKKDIDTTHRNLGHPSSTTNGEILS